MSKGNVNKIILVGRLGQAPILRHTAKGTPVLNLSIATNRDIKNAQGESEEEATWHRATVWGKAAESCASYLTKGSRVYVDGELRMRAWTDKDGQERKTAEIDVKEIRFLGGDEKSGTRPTVEEPTLATALAN